MKQEAAFVDSAKKRQTGQVAINRMDLTGDGKKETVGYDTDGDGLVDALDTDGAPCPASVRTLTYCTLY